MRVVGTSPLLVAVDQGVNLKRLRALQRVGRIQLVQAHTLEQNFKGVRPQGKVFRIGMSPLGGPDMIGGDNYYAVERIIGKHNLADVEHVYAAWLNKNAYFVTENVDDFIHRGKREALEAALPGLLVRTTQELIEELRRARELMGREERLVAEGVPSRRSAEPQAQLLLSGSDDRLFR